jgi:hypothetical protein
MGVCTFTKQPMIVEIFSPVTQLRREKEQDWPLQVDVTWCFKLTFFHQLSGFDPNFTDQFKIAKIPSKYPGQNGFIVLRWWVFPMGFSMVNP